MTLTLDDRLTLLLIINFAANTSVSILALPIMTWSFVSVIRRHHQDKCTCRSIVESINQRLSLLVDQPVSQSLTASVIGPIDSQYCNWRAAKGPSSRVKKQGTSLQNDHPITSWVGNRPRAFPVDVCLSGYIYLRIQALCLQLLMLADIWVYILIHGGYQYHPI